MDLGGAGLGKGDLERAQISSPAKLSKGTRSEHQKRGDQPVKKKQKQIAALGLIGSALGG